MSVLKLRCSSINFEMRRIARALCWNGTNVALRPGKTENDLLAQNSTCTANLSTFKYDRCQTDIANKLRELELKRDRDRQEASEERASKRLKKDPA